MSNLQSCKDPAVIAKTTALHTEAAPIELSTNASELESVLYKGIKEIAIDAANGDLADLTERLNSLTFAVQSILATKEEEVREEAYENGRDHGYDSGFDEGRDDGLETGREEGLLEGLSQGKSEGYDEGYAKALAEFKKNYNA